MQDNASIHMKRLSWFLKGRGHCSVEAGLYRGGHEPDKGCRGNLTKRNVDSTNSLK